MGFVRASRGLPVRRGDFLNFECEVAPADTQHPNLRSEMWGTGFHLLLGFCLLTVGQVAGAPEVPAGDVAPGLPAGGAFVDDVGFGEVGGGYFVCWLELAEGEGEAFADAVVVNGQDVGAAEAEDEQHLDGPLADAADLREVLDDVFVGHAADAGEGGAGAVEGLGGE